MTIRVTHRAAFDEEVNGHVVLREARGDWPVRLIMDEVIAGPMPAEDARLTAMMFDKNIARTVALMIKFLAEDNPHIAEDLNLLQTY